MVRFMGKDVDVLGGLETLGGWSILKGVNGVYVMNKVEEVKGMNMNDIDVALMFLYSDDNKASITLQCHSARDIPYIKRAIHQRLGAPSKAIDNALYYPNKTISIIPVHREEAVRGIPEHELFYVAHEDDSDWHKLVAEWNE